MRFKKPIIGITMGDPAGIGPEIIAKTLSQPQVYQQSRPIVIGDYNVMQNAVKIARKRLSILPTEEVNDAKFICGNIDLLDLKNVDMRNLKFGKVIPMAGKAAGEYIEKAVKLAQDGDIHAIVTAPIHKESLNLGGYLFPGHTEMLAHLTGTKKYAMVLVYGNFRVIHVTTHLSLRKAINGIKKARILEVINIAHEACKTLGVRKPRIAVAGLNPHASDGGIFGDEEEKEIKPAIEKAKKMNINVDGPVPADTVFPKALGGWYDIVVCMYHDQGHIPLKLMGFVWDPSKKRWSSVSGVNITLGLPIIRTSVDHGTAFGKAGKGIADSSSLLNAIELAVVLAKNKYKF